MAGRLAPVPEESADCSTAAYPPRSLYRDSIRRVSVSGPQIRSALFSHSQYSHSGSSYSSGSGTSSSSRSTSATAADFGAHELKTIARRMARDGYTQRMVQAFSDASPVVAAQALGLGYSGLLEPCDMVSTTPTRDQDRVLEAWFFELDVDWVLQVSQCAGSSLQDSVERWSRGLTVMVHSIVEQHSTSHEMTAVKRFGEASISRMLLFIDVIIPALKAENLRAVLDMHICLGTALCHIDNSAAHSELVQFPSLWLALAAYKLRHAIPRTMKKVRTLVEDDDSWALEILRGGGEVHRNTRWIVDCIVSLGEAEIRPFCLSVSTSTIVSDARDDTIGYLKDLLVRKSELCSDPSMRYLFLLNNSYFAAQVVEPCQPGHNWKLTPECEKYMDSYLDVSWGHVLSCIPKSHFRGPLHRWINTTSLVKFESAFNKTYQAQKFWKVPDPQLRDALRRAITDKVVSCYCDYLNEHLELAEYVSRRNTTPKVLEEMLGQLFEG